MTTQLLIRVEDRLKNKLNSLARLEGKSSSQVIRELMKDYVQNNDPAAYIEDLWERAGKKIRKKIKSPRDIDKIIRQVRKERAKG